MADWNVEKAMASVRASNTGDGRKLTFNERCAAFALMYGGAKNMVVARAFGISATTASNIAGCLEYDPHPYQREMVYDEASKAMVERTRERDHNRTRNPNRSRRYEDVAREFEALGEAEFNRRYVTEEIFNRARLANRQLRAGASRDPHAKPKDLSNMSAPEIRAWLDNHPDDPRNHS
jgi:hypothetical protein